MDLFSRKKKKEEEIDLSIIEGLVQNDMVGYPATACRDDLPLAGSMSGAVVIDEPVQVIHHVMTYDNDNVDGNTATSLVLAVNETLWNTKPSILLSTQDNSEVLPYCPIVIAKFLEVSYYFWNYKHYKENIEWKLTLLFKSDTCIEKTVEGIVCKVFKLEEEKAEEVGAYTSEATDEDF